MSNKMSSQAESTTVQELDIIEEIVSEIENYGKMDAFDAYVAANNEEAENYFKQGGILLHIKDNGWSDEEGYNSFKDLVQEKFGMNYQKASRLIQFYTKLTEEDISWKEVSTLGWSVLRELVPVITRTNVSEWVEKCQGLTVVEVRSMVVESQKGSLDVDEKEEPTNTMSTFSVKVFEDQKENILAAIEKAKMQGETETVSVALEAICMAFMSDALAGAEKLSLLDLMKVTTPEDVLETFEVIWPDIHLEATIPDSE